MHTTIHAVDEISERIERAYRRRRPRWSHTTVSPQVWEVAAGRLLEVHRADPTLPIDPELFVASQPEPDEQGDPWRDLTSPASARRYRGRIRQIVSSLRQELRQELRWVREKTRQGDDLDAVLASRHRSTSPMGRYIAARRADRVDLADSFREEARAQHQACPLYRLACRGLIHSDSYPVRELIPGVEMGGVVTSPARAFSLN